MRAVEAMDSHGEDGLAVLAFKVQALQFDLNRDLKFISMKDQLIRGRTLVLAARQAGLIEDSIAGDDDKANVIVIGGGVGGVSAALMAYELGLSVKLIEASDSCFPLLAMGSDRLFSATVYDWPHVHSGCHEFPYIESLRDEGTAKHLRATAKTLKFPAFAMTGSDLRREFNSQLSAYQLESKGALDVLVEHRLGAMDDIWTNEASGSVIVRVAGSRGIRNLTGQIVIFALGFGLDKKNEQTLAARDFFSYSGLASDIEKANENIDGGLVRIVGAGDGGLQEALRFLLDDDWHDLHQCIELLETTMQSNGFDGLWAKLCSRLHSAEDQAMRSLMWGFNENHIYRELDAIYKREAEALIAGAWEEVKSWYVQVARVGKFRVQLVDKSAYSLKAYALNRWLVALIERAAPGCPDRVQLERIDPVNLRGAPPDVELERKGFAAAEKPVQLGTAAEGDLLRRIAFQGIPMNLDAVI